MDINRLESLSKNKSPFGIPASIRELVQENIIQASKAISDHLEEKFAGIELDLGQRMTKALVDRHDRSVRAELSKALSDLSESFLSELEKVKAESKAQIEFLRQSYESGMERIERLLSALQIPAPQVQVNLPDSPVPQVNVSLPELAPQVVVSSPEIKFPELKMPEVVVNTPKRGKTLKRISYDEYGRPSEIVEEEE